jgi:hypothetical protein
MNDETKAWTPGFKHSVENLAYLYSMVAALSLSAAISQVIDPKGEGVPIRLATLPLLGVFLVTLVPFYHGALRHLHDAHMGPQGNIRRGASLVDFTILFVEGCLFIVLAALLTNVRYFAWAFVMLLGLDAFWGILAYLAFSRQADSKSELTWAVINFFTLILTALFLLISPSWGLHDKILGWCLFLIALTRTAMDYGMCWRAYFPAGEAEITCPSTSTMKIPKDYSLPIPSPSQGHPRRDRRTSKV